MHTRLPSTIRFNLHTALLLWWRTFFTHKPMFLSWPQVFLPQPFLQTSTLDPWYYFSYSLYFPESSSPSRGGGLFYSLSADCFILYQQKWSCDLNDIRSWGTSLILMCEGRDRVYGCLKPVQIHNLKLTLYFNPLSKVFWATWNVSLGSMITLEIFHLPNLYFRKTINWTWLVFYHFLRSWKCGHIWNIVAKIEVPSWQKGYIFSVWDPWLNLH